MEQTQTFRQYLEEMLGQRAEDPKVAERIVRRAAEVSDSLGNIGYVLSSIEARKIDREEILLPRNDEDFILFHLPEDMTLYEPFNLIDATKLFYENRGLIFDKFIFPDSKKYEQILNFNNSNNKHSGFAQLDLGPGYYTHSDKFELWVTTHFRDFE
jgi:anion-transporting  ArsA/GET3 family ATPase|tara:strand:- start:611 stop:1078 length:468 start_codon:yes stop_codon:yes gene_type:complete